VPGALTALAGAPAEAAPKAADRGDGRQRAALPVAQSAALSAAQSAALPVPLPGLPAARPAKDRSVPNGG
jgi:hypothetical protein